MINKRIQKHILFGFLLCYLGLVPLQFTFGQNNVVNIEIDMSPTLQNAQILSLTGLGIDDKGSGPVLISGLIENLTDTTLDNLYLEVFVNAARRGTIVELTQKISRPFSLQPFQTVYATNNDLAKEQLPGVQEKLAFDGGLTTEGDNLINSLSGSAALPEDTYSIQVVLYQITDAVGRKELARAFAETGISATAFEGREIYLKAPGDVVGSAAEITNKYPRFSWDGEPNVSYRLLVVRANGADSPQSLLENAKSSQPLNTGGSLLPFEHLDITIENNSYQFPTSGVQPLVAGADYYWQVLTILQFSGSAETVASEIWSFKLLESDALSTLQGSDDLNEMLIELLGASQFNELYSNGYVLEGIEFDGVQQNGQAALLFLEQILQKIRDEELIIINN